jgi:Mg2+-importing ATPase
VSPFKLNARNGAHSSTSSQTDMGAYWSRTAQDLTQEMASKTGGLTQKTASDRLRRWGANVLDATQGTTFLGLLISQFKNPLVLILMVASVISMVAAEWVDAGVVLAIVLGSTLLGFTQEYVASNAIKRLRAKVKIHSQVLRDGRLTTIPSESVVPGDVVVLSAGSLIPADGVVLESKDFFINQAVLTGETFPVEKKPGVVAESASLSERSNCVFMGTSVSSGTARALVMQTGKASVCLLYTSPSPRDA